MSEGSMRGEPPISLEAAHAADKEKTVTYPPSAAGQAPDFEALRARVLAATREARRDLGDA